MRRVRINRIDLELAFELSDYDVTAYLDRETGRVLYVEEYISRQLDDLTADKETLDAALAAIQAMPTLFEEDRAQMLDAARVEWDAEGRYLPIPRQDTREGYRDMEKFIDTLDDQHLRELLEVAIRGRGAFRRFKDVLYRYPDTEVRWFQFRDAREHNRLLDWLTSEDIEPEFE